MKRTTVGLCAVIKMFFPNVTKEELTPLVKMAGHVELGYLAAEALGLRMVSEERWEVVS